MSLISRIHCRMRLGRGTSDYRNSVDTLAMTFARSGTGSSLGWRSGTGSSLSSLLTGYMALAEFFLAYRPEVFELREARTSFLKSVPPFPKSLESLRSTSPGLS